MVLFGENTFFHCNTASVHRSSLSDTEVLYIYGIFVEGQVLPLPSPVLFPEATESLFSLKAQIN